MAHKQLPDCLDPELIIPISRQSSEVFKTGAWSSVRPLFQEKTAPCRAACPAGNNIPTALAAAARGDFDAALAAFLEEDKNLREASAGTLIALGDPAVGKLAGAWPEEDAEGQQRIAKLLAMIESPSAVQALVDALQDWRTRKAAAAALGASDWKPASPEDRVHLWVGQDRRDDLMDQWRITRYVLSKDLTSGSGRDMEYAVRAWIALGHEESIPEMLDYFDENENQDLALMLLQSENPRLEEAASRWFRSQRLDPEAMRTLSIDTAPPVRWGSMARPQ